MKRLTTEEFVERAKEIHGGKYNYQNVCYKTNKIKVDIVCPIHGAFQQTPKIHLLGGGCPQCSIKNKTFNYSFLEKAKERFGDAYSFPNISKEYKNSKSKITIHCNKCDNVFVKIAGDFITSKFGGCKCYLPQNKTYTFNDINNLVESPYKLVPFTKPLLKSEKVKLYCPKHGQYTKSIKNIIDGNVKCQKCTLIENGKKRAILSDEFENLLRIKYPTIKIAGEYTNYSHPLKFKCDICSKTFVRTPSTFINQSFYEPCPICAKSKLSKERTKTTQEFIAEVKSLYGDRFTILSPYTKSANKVDVLCNDCNKMFSIEANSLLQGHTCPYHNINNSKCENEIFEFVKSISPDAEQGNRTILDGKELDIYIPSKNLAIEYNGLYWHSDACGKDVNYHLNKTEECERQGIQLIHIFEDEWIYKQEIVKSYLNHFLGVTKLVGDANEHIIKKVKSEIAEAFLEQNHIQGGCRADYSYGLYCDGVLLSLMSFGKISENDTYELLRFCSKLNTNAVEAPGKLLKAFLRDLNPSEVISYADKRWSQGNLYKQLGFEHIGNTSPNYFYVFGDKRENKNKYAKRILIKEGYDTNKTEKQIMLDIGIYRIYDCGSMLFKLKC